MTDGEHVIRLEMRGPIRSWLNISWWRVQKWFGRGPHVTYRLATPEEFEERKQQIIKALNERSQ